MASSSSSFFCFFILLVHLWNASAHLPNFTAILVFGDSTVDTGNNNFIPTLFKSNYSPYGREFPSHKPNGRFSDGKLVPDLLASALGIKDLVPPFLDPTLPDVELRTGVDFASAGTGFDDLTTVASRVITMSQQLQHFKEYIERLKRIVGEQEANKTLNGALVVISAGTNDFLFSFYDIPTRREQFDIAGYQDFLQQKLKDFVRELFDLGGQNFLIAGLPPFGCVPLQLTAKVHLGKGCVEGENADARLYNSKLITLLKQLQESRPGSKVVYFNIYDPFLNIMNNPQKYGFVETRRGCCVNGLVEAGPLCNLLTPPCADASKYIFWDSIHPGEVVYRYITNYTVENALPLFFS